MQFKNIAVASALTAGALAEFAIFTTPIPTNLAVLSNPASYIASVENYVTKELGSLTASGQSSLLSAASSANSALAAFVKTATVSVPSGVTAAGALETFSATPAWYSALPSDLKSYYDAQNSKVQSIINQAVLGTQPAGSGASATGSQATKTGSGASSTGAANSEKVVGIVGAGVAAAFAGVLAL